MFSSTLSELVKSGQIKKGDFITLPHGLRTSVVTSEISGYKSDQNYTIIEHMQISIQFTGEYIPDISYKFIGNTYFRIRLNGMYCHLGGKSILQSLCIDMFSDLSRGIISHPVTELEFNQFKDLIIQVNTIINEHRKAIFYLEPNMIVPGIYGFDVIKISDRNIQKHFVATFNAYRKEYFTRQASLCPIIEIPGDVLLKANDRHDDMSISSFTVV